MKLHHVVKMDTVMITHAMTKARSTARFGEPLRDTLFTQPGRRPSKEKANRFRTGANDSPRMPPQVATRKPSGPACLLYTSDAADDLLCVDLGGRRIIKK